jgi:type IV secretory pathway TrbD component
MTPRGSSSDSLERWKRVEHVLVGLVALALFAVLRIWELAGRTLGMIAVGSWIVTAATTLFLIWFVRRAHRRQAKI